MNRRVKFDAASFCVVNKNNNNDNDNDNNSFYF